MLSGSDPTRMSSPSILTFSVEARGLGGEIFSEFIRRVSAPKGRREQGQQAKV